MCSTPDELLRAAVLSALAADRRTAAVDLRVGVSSGLVHLAGRVGTPEERTAAAEIAGQLPGVRGVVNRIEAPGAPSPARIVQLTTQGDRLDED